MIQYSIGLLRRVDNIDKGILDEIKEMRKNA